jgi:hypothetical protein
MDSLNLLDILLILLVLYPAPSYIAFYRGHQNAIAICVLNVLLGWTFFGWSAALVWSCTATRRTV